MEFEEKSFFSLLVLITFQLNRLAPSSFLSASNTRTHNDDDDDDQVDSVCLLLELVSQQNIGANLQFTRWIQYP